jgi:hypothetical protein
VGSHETVEFDYGDADRNRRRLRRYVVAIVVMGLLLVASMIWALTRASDETQQQAERADRAAVGAEQLCQQVRQLGGVCAVDPASLRGDPGPIGPPGPPGVPGVPGRDGVDGASIVGPSGAPGADGKDGVNGTDGKDGVDGRDGVDGMSPAACPSGWHQESREYLAPNRSVETALFCVPDQPPVP